ncbi:MmcQ/YjbR family DNA-binding protein [bacterium]|nr:MmcQ/YjbR family DNA-binding protein [bacterium]
MNNIFKNKKSNFNKLSNFGFIDNTYKTEIMNGEFILIVKINNIKEVSTELIEKDSGEIYTLHLVEYVQGPFVGQVKEEYEKVLSEIAEKCFDKDVFKFEYSKLVINYAKEKYGDDVEYLWEKFPDNAVCRRKDNKKWYFAILTVGKDKLGFESKEKVEVIDLRAPTEEIEKLVDNKKYFAGYHMNKRHWLTIILDGSVPIEEIYKRIDKSYNLALK